MTRICKTYLTEDIRTLIQRIRLFADEPGYDEEPDQDEELDHDKDQDNDGLHQHITVL